MAYIRFLKLPEVIVRTGRCKSSIWAAIKSGSFPKPIKIGSRSIGFIESEIEDHNQACIDKSRPGAQYEVDETVDEVSE